MDIRIAQMDDLEAMVEILNQSINAGELNAYTELTTTGERLSWFNEHKPEKYPILVAEIDNKVVGYASISPYRADRSALRFTGEISYYLHFDYHRRGIGSKLMGSIIELCPSCEIKTLFAILMDNNESSIGLLEKYGFERWGHMPGVVDFDGKELGHLYYGLRV